VLSKQAAASANQSSMVLVSKKVMSRLAAPLLHQMGIDSRSAPLHLLDSACGTGVVTQEVQRLLPRDVLERSTVLSADGSEALVDLVKRRIEDEAWVNVQARVLDAMVRFPVAAAYNTR
jgi:ubiquinone/menaquinone biosynthesis C-methylase UbiE